MVAWLAHSLAALAVTVMCSGVASAGTFVDPNGAFALTYDDAVWSLEYDEKEKDLTLSCRRNSQDCAGAFAACSVASSWVPFGNVQRLTDSFDGDDIARVQLEAFAKQKADTEKITADRSWEARDFPPRLVQPYMRRDIAGHPVFEAEFRVSIAGEVGRYMSYSTAARGYSVVSSARPRRVGSPHGAPISIR